MKNPNRMTTTEAAEYVGLSPKTLTTWRWSGKHKIKYLKLGGRVFYRQCDLDAWLKTRERTQVEA